MNTEEISARVAPLRAAPHTAEHRRRRIASTGSASSARRDNTLGRRIDAFVAIVTRSRLTDERHCVVILEELKRAFAVLAAAQHKSADLAFLFEACAEARALVALPEGSGKQVDDDPRAVHNHGIISGLEKVLFDQVYAICFQPEFADDDAVDDALHSRLSPLADKVLPSHCGAKLEASA